MRPKNSAGKTCSKDRWAWSSRAHVLEAAVLGKLDTGGRGATRPLVMQLRMLQLLRMLHLGSEGQCLGRKKAKGMWMCN